MLHKYEIGVCVDGDVAYLLEKKNDENLITIIHADDVTEEVTLRAKRKMRKRDFYKKVFEMIRDFDRVSLCGPARARDEIRKLFRKNSVRDVTIEDEPAENGENPKIDFINRYFS